MEPEMITVANKRTHKPTPRDIYIGRPSAIGNPYTHIPKGTIAEYVVSSRDEAISRYKEWLLDKIAKNDKPVMSALSSIKPDSVLVCWCDPLPCHGHVIAGLFKEGVLSFRNGKILAISEAEKDDYVLYVPRDPYDVD
jgi:hypothetical protein